jgi:hypothetical protein
VTRSDDRTVVAVIESIDQVRAHLLAGSYSRARDVARELTDGIGYPTSTPGADGRLGRTAQGGHTDPTGQAATNPTPTRAVGLANELRDNLAAFHRAANNIADTLTYAIAAGLTAGQRSICVWCGRRTTSEPDDQLINGICIRHRCAEPGCDRIPTGTGNDRLRRGLCTRHYAADRRRDREQTAATDEASSTHPGDPEP